MAELDYKVQLVELQHITRAAAERPAAAVAVWVTINLVEAAAEQAKTAS